MSELPTLINDLALILIVAGVVTLVFKKLRQPLALMLALVLHLDNLGIQVSAFNGSGLHLACARAAALGHPGQVRA